MAANFIIISRLSAGRMSIAATALHHEALAPNGGPVDDRMMTTGSTDPGFDGRGPHAPDPRIQALIAYWRSRRMGRPMPLRRDFDLLVDMPRTLPNLLVIERLADGGFLHRYVGSVIVALARRDATGHLVDGIWYGNRYADILRAYDRAIDEATLIWGVDRATWPDGEWRMAEWLIMPLARTDGTPGWVATYTVVLDGPVTAYRPQVRILRD